MQRYFVDTWFFIAFFHRGDAHHRAARMLARELRDAEFFTHDGVLTELLSFFAGHGSFWRQEIAAFVRDVLSSEQYKVTPVDRRMFEEALSMYERRLDKEYSLVDCVSMRMMLRRSITRVLTNDHHFRQEGFTVVSE
jgi:predicted nucleic acid-binding protein